MVILEKNYNKIKYIEYHPNSFNEKKRYPVILHLHGAGSRGDDLNIIKYSCPLMKYASSFDGNFPYIIVSPQCRENSWFDIFEQLMDFSEQICSLTYIDNTACVLSGISMGGYAAWQLLESKPELFKKAIICCGGGMYWNADRIKAEIIAFHGKNDVDVCCEESVNMVEAMNRCGGKATYKLYDGLGHNCWDNAYSDPNTYKFIGIDLE